MSLYPLVAHRQLSDVLAYCRGKPISVGGFLADVQSNAAALAPECCVLNACSDRYRFAVGLAAALLAGKVSVLPADLAPVTIRHLATAHPDLVCLTDGEITGLELPLVSYREGTVGAESLSDAAWPRFDERQPLAWLYTSGSTGHPVPHLKRWGAFVRSVAVEASRLGLDRLPRATIVATVPPQHSYGLESSVLLALQSGIAFSAGRPFYPIDICRALAEVPRPRILVSTPYHLRLLLDSSVDVPALDMIVSATAPLSAVLAQQLETRLRAPLFEIFGSTDTGQIASRRTVEGAEWRLFDGVVLSSDGQSTWASGGHVGAPVSLPDLVEITGKDRFLLQGRSADLVNIAGKRSSIAFLTHQLTAIPGVVDGAYLLPDENPLDGVTRLAALVVAPALRPEQVLRALRTRVDPVFLPRPLVFVEALPRSTSGKMPREALCRMLESARRSGL